MPYVISFLLGAGSAFAAHFLVENYVGPRVDTRMRREARWEQDVLALGELLSTSVRELAGETRKAQWMVQMVFSGELDGQADPDQVSGYLSKLRRDAQQATGEFTELTESRVDWIADRIIEFRPGSDQMTEFAIAWARYRLKIAHINVTKYGEVTASDLEAFWDSERALRTGLESEVKQLARLRHPPRASRRHQARYVRRSITARLKRRPLPIRPSEVAAGDTDIAVALRARKGTASPWHG